MKRILCSLLVATLPFGSVLADPPKAKNAGRALRRRSLIATERPGRRRS